VVLVAATAFPFTAIGEKYMVLGTRCVKATRQGLSRKNGHNFDVYKVESKGGRLDHMMYFSVDISQNSLHRKLENIQDERRKNSA
jgi:hypothetical protein